MSTTYTLSDGVVVELSDRKSNKSGYTGAALSPSWTLDMTKPFIAACGNPTDPKVMAEVNAQKRTSLHLGNYEDAREAAYVIGRYHQDPIATIRTVQQYGEIDTFPSDLYNLPVGLGYAAAVSLIKQRKLKVKVAAQPVVDPTTTPATGNVFNFFSKEQVIPVAKKLGGPEQFQAAIKGLTISEFAKKFNLTVKA